MRPTAISTSRLNITSAALCAIGIAPILLMLYIVVTNWLPLPYWDEWTTPGETFTAWCEGTLSWRHLFSQHSESRKFFPRLLYLALAQLGGWDVRKEMTLIFLSVCATAVLFWRLMRKLPGATSRSALLAWIAGAFLCFSAVQFENFLWGVQVEVFFPGLALLAMAAVNLSGLSFPRKALLNGALALIATYTIAHGMLLWILGVPLFVSAQSFRKTWLVYLAYFACAAVAIGAYFIGYQHPSVHPPFFAGESGGLSLARYLILWVGSYFHSPQVDPFLIGGTATLILIAALAGAALIIRRTREWRPFYPALLMAAYACATAAITAAGRIGFGVEQALTFRYRAYSLFFYLAIVALLFAVYCSHFRRAPIIHRRLFLAGCSVAGLVTLAAWIACYLDGSKHQKIVSGRNLTLLRALEWIEVIPDNPDLAFLFPSPASLRQTAGVLRNHQILRLGFVQEQLARKVSQAPPPIEGDPFGRLESCVFDTKGHLVVAGRARGSEGKPPPSYVVLGALDSTGRFKPFAAAPLRSQVKDKNDLRFVRPFNPANLPAGDLTIAAWAIDAAGHEAYPLGGATSITTAKR